MSELFSYPGERDPDTLDDAYDRFRDGERHEAEFAREMGRLDRRDEFRGPDPRPAKRLRKRDVPAPDHTWRESVFERDGFNCPVHDDPKDCEWPPAAHHVVLAQLLRRDGHINAVYARAAGMTVCSRAHRQHHNRVRPIFLDEIPAECVTFAVELGYGDWLERTYPRLASVAA